MPRYPFRTLFCSFLLLPFVSLADTIVLSSGEKIEGKVLANTDTSVEIEVTVSSGISDVRTVPKSDILRIDKADPAVLAFTEIKAVQPGANSLAVEEYDRILYGRLKPFLNKYPLSANTAAVQQAFDAFTEEKARVQKGEVKINSRWFTADEISKDKIQIGAMLLFQQMRASGAAGDAIDALNQFTALEKNYKGARIFPDAVGYAQSLIPGVKQDIVNKTILLKRDLTAREQGMALVPDYRKAELVAAAKQEETDTNSKLDAAKAAGQIWTPIYPRSQRSLDDLAKVVDSESKRLSGLKVQDMVASMKASEQGRELLKNSDVIGAQTFFADAAKLWPDNAMVKENAAMVAAIPKDTPTPKPETVKAEVKNTPVKVVNRTPPPTPTPEPEKSFLLSVPGIITIVVVVAGIAIFTMVGKSRKRG